VTRGLWAAALIAVLALAALPRLASLNTEPWLDEVWSINLSRQAPSAADAFYNTHDDNSNPLNTLYLHYVSPGLDWAKYRFLSLVAGLLALAVLGWDPEDRARGILAASLGAVSTHMILYATEARGYALMSLFSLACYRLLRAPFPMKRSRAAAFGLCALLGFLSHPTFLYVYAALFLWAAAKIKPAKRVKGLLELFGPATLAYVLFQAAAFPVRVGGASENNFATVLLSTLELWSGAPARVAAGLAGAAVLLALLGWELKNLRRERRDEFIFFAALFAGACAFDAIFPFRFERHFYAALPFALLLAAGALARLFRQHGAKRLIAGVIVLFFLIGNGARDRALAADGRGHYLEAIQRMAAETPGDEIAVASDHDKRNGMMVEFYGPLLGPPKKFVYVPQDRYRERTPDWYLIHSFDATRATAPIGVTIKDVGHYALVDVYPYSGLSGWTWMLYRRDSN
jgi:hypothetical protein